jgi:hypothetical protein
MFPIHVGYAIDRDRGWIESAGTVRQNEFDLPEHPLAAPPIAELGRLLAGSPPPLIS